MLVKYSSAVSFPRLASDIFVFSVMLASGEKFQIFVNF